MKTDELIAELAVQASPIRPLPPPGTRTLAWFIVAIASVGIGVAVFGARPNIDVLLSESDFLLAGLLALATALFGIFGALVLAVPGAERTPAPRVVTVSAVVLWVGLLSTAVALAGVGFSGVSHWYVCFVRVCGIAFVPAVAIVVMLRRAMPLRRSWTNGLAMAGAFAMGAFAIQFICPLPDAGHALFGHLAPVVTAALAGIVIGLRRR